MADRLFHRRAFRRREGGGGIRHAQGPKSCFNRRAATGIPQGVLGALPKACSNTVSIARGDSRSKEPSSRPSRPRDRRMDSGCVYGENRCILIPLCHRILESHGIFIIDSPRAHNLLFHRTRGPRAVPFEPIAPWNRRTGRLAGSAALDEPLGAARTDLR